VAVAALRSPSAQAAAADDHAAVLRVWSKRHRDLGRLRTQLVCRLHAVLCELLPGGVATEMTAGQAAQLLGPITTCGAVAAARRELAAQSPPTCAASTRRCATPRTNPRLPSGRPGPA
jgi:hypothetical protein